MKKDTNVERDVKVTNANPYPENLAIFRVGR